MRGGATLRHASRSTSPEISRLSYKTNSLFMQKDTYSKDFTKRHSAGLEEEKMKRRNGLTLVELLSATAIIVLLVSIFLPSLQNVKRQASPVYCRDDPRNDITLSPIELVLVSPDGISGRPTIIGTFPAWGQIPENPDPYGNYVLNLWICDNRCVSTKCECRHCWTSHTCIDQPEDNTKEIVLSSLLNQIEQKQTAR